MSATEEPFGARAPNALQAGLIALARALPATGLGRLASSPFRRLLLATLDGPIDVETLGFKARLDPRDNLSDKRAALLPDAFDKAEREALAHAIGSASGAGFTFVDAGANTGLYSLFVAARAGPSARILAIEPQPGVKERLAFNIAANGFHDRIAHLDAALAEGPGEATLHIHRSNKGQASLNIVSDTGVSVRTVGLLDAFDQADFARPDALKIDIEGAEDRVLPAFFSRCPSARLPRMILMERNNAWAVDCVDLALSTGYVITVDVGRNVVLARN